MKKLDSNGIHLLPVGLQKGSVTDQVEDRSAYLRSDANVTWSGTQFSFTDDIVLEIIDNFSGTTTTHNISSSNSPVTLANNESIWVLIDRTASSETVTMHQTTITAIPVQSSAQKDVFIIAKARSDGTSTYLHIPLHKQILKPGDSLRLGTVSATISLTIPTIQIFDYTGSVASYTPSMGVLYSVIELQGAGGGGGATLGSGATNPGTSGGPAIFSQTTPLNFTTTAGGGGGGAAGSVSGAPGGSGGAVSSSGSGFIDFGSSSGQDGLEGSTVSNTSGGVAVGGRGGSSRMTIFGTGGDGGVSSYGGGAISGGGGGAGAYWKLIIPNPTGTFQVSVGQAGSGGSPTGNNGFNARILITEYYQ